MRHRGIPLDKSLCEDLATHWPALQQELTDDLNLRYPFFEGASFRQKLLRQWLIEHDVRYWPLTPTGKLKTDAETLRAMAARCSAAAEFCHSKITLNAISRPTARSPSDSERIEAVLQLREWGPPRCHIDGSEADPKFV
jgi:hypothetical protein